VIITNHYVYLMFLKKVYDPTTDDNFNSIVSVSTRWWSRQ